MVFNQKRVLCVLIFVQVIVLGIWFYLRLYYWSGKVLRVVEVEESPLSFFSPFGKGVDFEIANLLAKKHKLKLKWQRVPVFKDAFFLLKQGKVDVIVGVPTKIKINDPKLAKGPNYIKDNFLFIHNKYRYPLRRFDELCKYKVIVPLSSLSLLKIKEYDEVIFCPINYEVIQKREQDLYELIAENKARFMLTDKIRFNNLNPYFLDLRKTYEFKTKFSHVWIWTKQYKKLNKMLEEFWHSPQTKEFIDATREIYYGFFRDNVDYYQLEHLRMVIRKKLPLYEQYILDACQKFSLDPLFLIAQIYQESHFNPKARSRTGVRGLLQLSLNTASWIGIDNRLNPRQSILGGAKYMAFLVDRIAKRGVKGWNKWCMALAAYNQGLGHLYDAMDLVKLQGKDASLWSNVKEVYPLLSYRKYYKKSRYGYCRGYEAITYVQNVRYYYYMLSLLAFFGGGEGDYLRSFFPFRPNSWL